MDDKGAEIPEYDFTDMADLDLVIMRKDSKDFGDIDFVRAIDKELKKREKERHET